MEFNTAEVPPKVSINYGAEIVDYRVQKPWKAPRKLVIKACIANGFISKNQNPVQPTSVEEVMKEAFACADAGATSLHLHPLDDMGKPSGSIELHHLLYDPIRERYGRSIVYDGSVASGKTIEECTAAARAKFFEVAVVKTGSVFMGDKLTAWNSRWITRTVAALQEIGCKPQITCHDTGYIDMAGRLLIETGLLKKPTHWLIATGMPGCSTMWDPFSAAESLMFCARRIRELDPEAVIMVGGGGRAHHHLAALAVVLGLDGVRVGTEDALYQHAHQDHLLESAAEMVAATKSIALAMGREIASAADYREMLGLL